MLITIHLLLAFLSALATALVALEAGWRAWNAMPATTLTRGLGGTQVAVLLVTVLVGLGLVASGQAAGSGLHYLLAIVALASVPLAPMLAVDAGPRRRAGATLATAILALVVVGLLFMTG